MFTPAPNSPTQSAVTTREFQIGDLVRVKAARRRDVVFTVIEVTPSSLRATRDGGGEAIYPAASFEHVTPLAAPSASVPSTEITSPSKPVKPGLPAFDLCDGTVIRPRPGEPIDVAAKRFKKACDKAGILHELRDRERFVPAPQRRRIKSSRARRRRGD
jgi:small subunit ribosomal protein S21